MSTVSTCFYFVLLCSQLWFWHTQQNPYWRLVWGRSCLYLKSKNNLNGGFFKVEQKIITVDKKHYIDSKFKPNDVFLLSSLYLIYGTGKKNLNSKLNLGFHLYKTFYELLLLSACCVMTNHGIAYIHNSWSNSENIWL